MPNQPAPTTPELLFARRVRDQPAAPFVTFYDDATGERAELSAKSLGNWIAKTHFLLIDSLGLGIGDRAALRLPVHWLAAPILFGCWFAGLHAVSTLPAGGVEVLFADAGSLAELAPGGGPTGGLVGLASEVFAVSLLSMGRPEQPPAGAEDFTTAVRPMPDAWDTVRAQAGPTEPALDGLARARLADRAAEQADELGLRPGGRLLWTEDWAAAAEPGSALSSALLAPLAAGASVVLVRNPDPAKLDQRVHAERVTVVR